VNFFEGVENQIVEKSSPISRGEGERKGFAS
jgi:hypothetical protein